MSKVGVVLGSGLGAFADSLEDRRETPYSALSGWPQSQVAGHAGKMVEGRVGLTEVIVLSGRVHLYEGYTPQQVAHGVRELARRGVRSVILTNASGAINLDYKPGDLVLISDHVNLQGVNPLTGASDEPRFPDMSEAYSADYRAIARATGAALSLKLAEGVYAGVPGPSFETPAEIRYLRRIGADLVGMSTIMEAIAANHAGMRVLGISCITNMAAGILPQKLTHAEVLEAGARVSSALTALLRAVVPQLA